MSKPKRVILMVVDGLRPDLMSPQHTPALCGVAEQMRHFRRQRSAFPSATRVNSATIATGCYPAQHRLVGNAMALDEGDGLKAVSVGTAEFRERWRRATGRTLHRPTLSERLAGTGGASIYANSSTGAAHMQDPDGHGWLYHRAGSHGPGLQPITDHRHPQVSFDAAGDAALTQRFCESWASESQPLRVLWICEPDHSQHHLELGSETHWEVLRRADACVDQLVRTVASFDGAEDILFMIASDHGHETVTEIIPVTELLIEAGFKASESSTDLVVAASGMGVLVYLAPQYLERTAAITAWLRGQDWADQIHAGADLARLGLPNDDGLAIAFSMTKSPGANRFGIEGRGAVAADPFSPGDAIGHGQHGGLGRHERNALLLVGGGGFRPGGTDNPSNTVDIAPTVLRHLGLPQTGLDGRALDRG